MDTVDLRLQQAIAAARARKVPQARVLLERLVRDEPDNVNALFLLGVLSESETEQVEYLNRVLEIEPEHERAKKRLAQLAAAGVSQEPPPLAESEQPLEALPTDETQMPELVDEPLERPGAVVEEVIEAESEQAPSEEVMAPLPEAPVNEHPLDFEAQAEADTIPAWLAEEGDMPLETPTPVQDMAALDEAPTEAEDLPDWLQEETAEDWLEQEQPAVGDVAMPERLSLEELADQEIAAEAPAGDATSSMAEPMTQGQDAGTESAAKKGKKSGLGLLEIVLIVLIVVAVIIVGALIYLVLNPPL